MNIIPTQPEARNLLLVQSGTDAADGSQHEPKGRKWVLAIGVDDYQDPKLQTLRNAANDASAIAKVLQSDFAFQLLPAGGLLVNGAATKTQVQQCLKQELQAVQDNDQVIIYFAGHGTNIENKGYLLPQNAVYSKSDSYISVSELIRSVLGCPAAQALIILDACYSGAALIREERDLDDHIPQGEQARKVRQILASGSPDEPVLDGGGSGHSVFTQVLLEVLRGEAGVGTEHGIGFDALKLHLKTVMPARVNDAMKGDRRESLRWSLARPGIQHVTGGNLQMSANAAEFTLVPQKARLPQDIVADLLSSNATVQQKAIERLGQRPTDEHDDITRLRVAKLRDWLLKPGPTRELEFAAVQALHKLQHPTAFGPLIQVLQQNWRQTETRAEAATALGATGSWNPSHVRKILEKVLDETGPAWQVRAAAAKALTSLIGDEALETLLEHYAQDPNPESKAGMLVALGSLHNPKTWPTLEGAIHAPNTRDAAIYPLVESGDPNAREILIDVYLKEPNESVGEHAVQALAQLRDPQTTATFIAILEDREADGARRAAADALCDLGDRQAVDSLIRCLGEGNDPSLRAVAARALGQLGDERAVQPLCAALDYRTSKDPFVQEKLVLALAKLEYPGAGQLLIEALRNPDLVAPYDILWAISDLKDPYTMEQVRQLLNQEQAVGWRELAKAILKL